MCLQHTPFAFSLLPIIISFGIVCFAIWRHHTGPGLAFLSLLTSRFISITITQRAAQHRTETQHNEYAYYLRRLRDNIVKVIYCR